MKKKLINEALQQMQGFKLGKWGADVRELVSSMGLKENEWEWIKEHEDNGNLDDNDIEEINKYFEDVKDNTNENHSPKKPEGVVGQTISQTHQCKASNLPSPSEDTLTNKEVKGCERDIEIIIYGEKMQFFCGDIVLGLLRLCPECVKESKGVKK